MPVPWIALPPISAPPIQTQVGEELTVVSKVVRYDRINNIYRFSQGVEARYGVTTVIADELEVHAAEDKEVAYARGNVQMIDPDGTLRAKNLTFHWTEDEQTGSADEIELDFAGVFVRAKNIDIKPGLWTLTDAYGTSCRNDPPLFAVRTPRITFQPGKQGRVERPELQLLGSRVVTLPTQRFNLDPRTQGIRPPSISYREEDGLGVSWDSGILIDEQTGISGTFSSFRGERPSYSLQVARSWVPAERSTRLVTPRSDLANRFQYSYFDNVEQIGPKAEEEYLREERNSVGVGTFWFQGSGNDPTEDTYSKPIEISYERGGSYRDFGGVAQARLQTIRRELEPVITRLQLNASAGPRPFRIAEGLYAYARTDATSFLGGSNSGWLRGQVGMTFQPVRQVTLAGSLHRSLDFGTARYPIDALDSPAGANIRIDFNLGPTQFTHLWRYDNKMGWFDRQLMLSQVAGCLEPYVLYREYDDDLRFGVNLRLGNLIEVLTRRRFERGNSGERTVIDSPGRAR